MSWWKVVRDILLAACRPLPKSGLPERPRCEKYTVLAKWAMSPVVFVGEGEVLAESRMRLLRDGVVVL